MRCSAIIIFAALSMFPGLREYLPIGGVEALISQPDSNPLEGSARSATAQQVGTFGESLFWLCAGDHRRVADRTSGELGLHGDPHRRGI